MIGSKITQADLKALRAVMKATGIATQSAAVTLAIRAFAKAHGIAVQLERDLFVKELDKNDVGDNLIIEVRAGDELVMKTTLGAVKLMAFEELRVAMESALEAAAEVDRAVGDAPHLNFGLAAWIRQWHKMRAL